MKKFLFVAFAFGPAFLISCGHSTPKNVSRTDTVIVAYNNGAGWQFNTAIDRAYVGRKWLKESGLDAKEDICNEFRIQLPPSKGDTLWDTLKHLPIRVIPHYSPVPINDTLNRYIHILDTLHNIPTN